MAIELKVPALGESITEAVVAKWLKNVGDTAKLDEPVVELETDKVTVLLPAPAAGVLAEQRAKVGATVKVGAVIGTMKEGFAAAVPVAVAGATAVAVPGAGAVAVAVAGATAAAGAVAGAAAAAAEVKPGNGEQVNDRLSPAERWALREKGARELVPDVVLERAHPREEVVSMTPLRRRIAERLVEAQHTAAILTTFNETDMSAVMELRTKHQEAFTAKHGIKLGFMSFFTKAVVEALKDWPSVNAELRGTEIVYKKHYDIGVAVGSGKGLVVPVVRDADRLGFAELEKAIADFGQRAKDNKLTLAELLGGTFTISNGGIYGSMLSTPLLNMPQTGILGMHNIIKRPIAVGDEVKIRPMMYLALSYDHRLVDGREAVSFLVGVKQRIEAPERLMFGL